MNHPSVLGKILEIALLFLRFFLRARLRSRSALASGLGGFISTSLLSVRREIDGSIGTQIRVRFDLSRFRETGGIASLFRGFRGTGSGRRWPGDGMPIDLFISRRTLSDYANVCRDELLYGPDRPRKRGVCDLFGALVRSDDSVKYRTSLNDYHFYTTSDILRFSTTPISESLVSE